MELVFESELLSAYTVLPNGILTDALPFAHQQQQCMSTAARVGWISCTEFGLGVP